MGLEVGGYHDRPDWPKMGPSLLIATLSHRGDQDGKVAGAFGRKTLRSGDERRDRVRRIHRRPGTLKTHDEERDDLSAAKRTVVPGE